MRNKIGTIILFFIMIILIGIIGFMIWALFTNNTENILETFQISNAIVSIDEDVEDQSSKKNSTALNTVSDTINSDTNTSNNNSEAIDSRFYYNQLSDTEKIIYDGLADSKEQMKSGTYTIEFEDQFSDILEQENGSEVLGDAYQSAIDAYIHDNADLFYLDVSKLYLNIETTKKVFSTTYNVFIGPKDGETYFNENFSSQSQVESAESQIEAIRDSILSELTNDDYENIKIIHDYLVENIEYNQNYESAGANSYSIYGALIQKEAVCEGYAKSFKYLVNAAGIECELVQGTATNSEGVTEKHQWNSVYLDGNWYYVDVTWDDPIVIGNVGSFSSYNYKYFLKGSQTFDEDHFVETQFVEDGKEFYYPEISTTDY